MNPFFVNKKFLENKSLGSSFDSPVVKCEGVSNFGITLKCSDVTDNTGAFVVKVSNDELTWEDFPLDSTPTLADANATFAISLTGVFFSFLKLSFTAAGTVPDGTVNATICGKGA